MAEENLPPQNRKLAFAAAGGGFGGALLAIVIAKILAGPCCCHASAADMRPAGKAVTSVTALSSPAADARPDLT